MRLIGRIQVACAGLGLVGTLAAVRPAGAESVTVPLSDPTRPAVVRANMVNGSIRVEAWAGKEVVVEAVPHQEADAPAGDDKAERRHDREDAADRKEDDEDRERESARNEKAKGMRKIPNTGLGLSVEESDNVVRIESESWRRGVDLRVKVPASTVLKLSCVNDGDIDVSGVEGEMELAHTNGSIRVKGAAGAVVANTVNGEITVGFARLAAFKSMAFSSLNGDVDVTLPAAIAADVRVSSDNGEIYSDFDVKLTPQTTPAQPERSGRGRYKVLLASEMRGVIGAGGGSLLFKTFNGDIYLRKGK